MSKPLAIKLLESLYRLSQDSEVMDIFCLLRRGDIVSDEQRRKFGAWVAKREAIVRRLKEMRFLAQEKLPSSFLDEAPAEAFTRFLKEHESVVEQIKSFLEKVHPKFQATHVVFGFLLNAGWAKTFGWTTILNLDLLSDPSPFLNEKMCQDALSWILD